MLKLKILLVEDKPRDSTLITQLLKENNDNIVGTLVLANSYDKALDILSSDEDFDLSILDVNLGKHKSFELIEQFPIDRFGIVTFMTSELIPPSILRKAHPVYQIEKPFDKAQIANYVSKIRKFKKVDQSYEIPKADGRTTFLKESQIYYVETVRNTKHSKFHYFDVATQKPGEFDSTMGLPAVKNTLSPDFFEKCNGSCIVNVTHIADIFKQDCELIFDNTAFGNINYSHDFLQNIVDKRLMV